MAILWTPDPHWQAVEKSAAFFGEVGRLIGDHMTILVNAEEAAAKDAQTKRIVELARLMQYQARRQARIAKEMRQEVERSI